LDAEPGHWVGGERGRGRPPKNRLRLCQAQINASLVRQTRLQVHRSRNTMYRGVAGFACCHIGAGEAWSGRTFVKFAAARPGEDAPQIF